MYNFYHRAMKIEYQLLEHWKLNGHSQSSMDPPQAKAALGCNDTSSCGSAVLAESDIPGSAVCRWLPTHSLHCAVSTAPEEIQGHYLWISVITLKKKKRSWRAQMGNRDDKRVRQLFHEERFNYVKCSVGAELPYGENHSQCLKVRQWEGWHSSCEAPGHRTSTDVRQHREPKFAE